MGNRIAVLAAVSALIVLSGATPALGQEGAAGENTEEAPILGSAEFSGALLPPSTKRGDFTLDINELKKSKSSGHVSLTYTVANNDDTKTMNLGNSIRSRMVNYEPSRSFSGAMIRDRKIKTAYFNLADEKMTCVCQETADSTVSEILEPGESATRWASFWVKGSPKTLDVQVPGFEPVENVKVS